MGKKKFIVIFFLVFVLICGVTPVVLGIVFSNPQSRVEFDTEGQYYKVNEKGITTIHIQGKIIAASPSNCMFHLAIPQDFEMVYLSNGSPILEVVNGGNPLTKTVSEEDFHVVFAVRTYAVTMDGWEFGILFGYDYNEDQMKQTTLHEIFHTYWAVHKNVVGRYLRSQLRIMPLIMMDLPKTN